MQQNYDNTISPKQLSQPDQAVATQLNQNIDNINTAPTDASVTQQNDNSDHAQYIKEEKMIRRPLMRSESQTDSDKSSGHEDSSSESESSLDNIGQQASNQFQQAQQTHKHKSHDHRHHKHNHHDHDHSSHDHSHHDHDHGHSHSHDQHGHSHDGDHQCSSHTHGHGESKKSTQPANSNNQTNQPQQSQQNMSLSQRQQERVNAIIGANYENSRLRQASFNDDEIKALDDIYNDDGESSKQRSTELTSNEYAQMLKTSFKNCFHSSDIENLDSLFKDLQKLITEIQICDLKVLDMSFFKKVVLLAQMENPKRCLKVVDLFQQLFNEKSILKYLLKLPDYTRIIVDIINSYYILLEKFKNTKLEIDLKISFHNFQNILDNQGHYEEFKVLIEQQTTLKGLNTVELNSDQKEIFETIKHYSKLKDIPHKQECIKYIVLLLGKCDTVIQQYKIMVHHLSPIFLELSNANYENNEAKVQYINQVLDLIDRYIFPIEFLINFDTSRIQGTKTYYLKNLKTIVQYFNKLYNLVGGFLNSVLLMPQEIQLNLRALFMIRRMYYFFYNDIQIRQLMEGPIIIILSNLAMFTKDLVQKKEPTLFLHKLLNDENTFASLKEKLESNEYVKTLKENKYFGVMAKCYPYDIDVQYNFRNLNFQVNYPVYKKIEAGSFFFYNILVTKPDTIIYWSFKTFNYDVKFGLFKMDTLSNELQIDSYEEEKQIKAIVKLQKADSHKEPVMAYSLVSLPGYYRIVFDNTYSYWREKELLYTIQVLEP